MPNSEAMVLLKAFRALAESKKKEAGSSVWICWLKLTITRIFGSAVGVAVGTVGRTLIVGAAVSARTLGAKVGVPGLCVGLAVEGAAVGRIVGGDSCGASNPSTMNEGPPDVIDICPDHPDERKQPIQSLAITMSEPELTTRAEEQ